MTPSGPDITGRDWWIDRLDRMEQRLLEHSRSVRLEMHEMFQRAEEQSSERNLLIADVRDRLLVVETQRAIEARQAIQRSALAGILAAGGLTAIWESVKHGLGWK